MTYDRQIYPLGARYLLTLTHVPSGRCIHRSVDAAGGMEAVRQEFAKMEREFDRGEER